jgi:CBS domain-containing protein
VPTLGGLVIGLLIRVSLRDNRPEGVADVIEAFAPAFLRPKMSPKSCPYQVGLVPPWGGFENQVLRSLKIADVMRTHPPLVQKEDDLQIAISKMTDSGESLIAVVNDMQTYTFAGTVEHMHVLAAYNRALLASRQEEHDQ